MVYYMKYRKEADTMTASDKVRGLLALNGKRQTDLAEAFGMSKQTMNNKLNRDSWSARDLVRVAEFCGCKLAFVLPDGQNIFFDTEPDIEKSPDE